ncbi:MAG: light-harvesting protein [Thiohalocapsa sp.]|jgi:light-harvesting complex 1 alpha chain|nr:light-harvesting protein [Thiohalocapsa sp.]
MHQIWLIFPPRLTLFGLSGFLLALALIIHIMLLSSPQLTWLS